MKAKVIRIHQADVLSPRILKAGRSSTYADRISSHTAPLFLTHVPVTQTSLRLSPPHLLICNYSSNLSLSVPQFNMIWLKLKQVLRRLTGKKQTSTTVQSYSTTSTITPTPPSLTRPSPEPPTAAPNPSTLDSTSPSITSSGQTTATRSSTVASLTTTITTAASPSDSGETQENTDVSGYVHILAQGTSRTNFGVRSLPAHDEQGQGTPRGLNCVRYPNSSVGLMQQGNVEESSRMAAPLRVLKDHGSFAVSALTADMDLFDGPRDMLNFQSLAAGAAKITASMATFDLELARSMLFEAQETVEHFHSLDAAVVVLNESAKSFISASGPSLGSTRTTSTPASPMSLYSSDEGKLSTPPNLKAPVAKHSHERPHLLQSAATILNRNFGTQLDLDQTDAVLCKVSTEGDVLGVITPTLAANVGRVQDDAADRQPEVEVAVNRLRLTTARNLRRKTLFAERTNTSCVAAQKDDSTATVVIADNYRTAVESLKAAAEARAAVRKTALTKLPPPVVFQDFKFCFEFALPERPTFAPAYPRTFAERYKSFASRLANIANYAGGEFVDPGAPDGGPSVEDQLQQEQTLNRANMAAFEGDDLLGDSDWAPTGFECAPEELITMEEKVRHMSGDIGHQWASYMATIHPSFRAETWAQDDLLEAVSTTLHVFGTASILTRISAGNQRVFAPKAHPRLPRSSLWGTRSRGLWGCSPQDGTRVPLADVSVFPLNLGCRSNSLL